METPSVDTLCKIYIKIRTKKQELTKELETQIEELDAQLKEVGAIMKDRLVEAGGSSLKTPHGTVYLMKKDKYYPMDYEAFGKWVISRGAIDLLEKRVAQSNMKKWVEENPTDIPPGLQCDSDLTVTVRKS